MLGNGESSLQQLGTVLQQQNQAFKLAFEIHTHTNKRGHAHTRAAITPTHTVTHTHTDCSVDTHTHTHTYIQMPALGPVSGERRPRLQGGRKPAQIKHTLSLSLLFHSSPPPPLPRFLHHLFSCLSLSLSLFLSSIGSAHCSRRQAE